MVGVTNRKILTNRTSQIQILNQGNFPVGGNYNWLGGLGGLIQYIDNTINYYIITDMNLTK